MTAENNGEKIKLYERIVALEVYQKTIIEKVDAIEKKVDSLNTKLWGVFVAIFLMLVGLVINFYAR